LGASALVDDGVNENAVTINCIKNMNRKTFNACFSNCKGMNGGAEGIYLDPAKGSFGFNDEFFRYPCALSSIPSI
jgi:hypothetical protein